MIKVVETKKDLKRFIRFVEDLYRDDEHFVPPIYYALTKELKAEVLEKKVYTALLSEEEGLISGRLLYTVDESKQKGGRIGFFSFFESIDDPQVAQELFSHMEEDLKRRGIDYVEGTFTPYDPDTRRGILVEGFEIDPTIMTSYNKSYYGRLLESCGYSKAFDTFSLEADICETTTKRMTTLENYFEKRYLIDIDPIDLKNMHKEISDIHTVLIEASTEINYQDAPSIEMIEEVAQNLKMFLNPDLIRIARVRDSREPIGFCFCLPDYNQVFKKTKGRIRLIPLLRSKKIITTVRGIMQYVVPKYQNTGLIGVMFKKVYDNFKPLGITRFEAGTMMEENEKSMSSFSKFGGRKVKTYRIYGKDLKK